MNDRLAALLAALNRARIPFTVKQETTEDVIIEVDGTPYEIQWGTAFPFITVYGGQDDVPVLFDSEGDSDRVIKRAIEILEDRVHGR